MHQNNNENRPAPSSVRREFKFDAVWENDVDNINDINLEFKPDAAEKKEEKKNGAGNLDAPPSRISHISSPRSLKSSLRSQRSIKRAPMTKCEVLKFLF